MSVISYVDSIFPNMPVDDIEKLIKSKVGSTRNKPIIFAIAHMARRTLPYGRWICEDGREVWFNREYQPIFQVINGVSSYADKNEWVKNIKSTMMVYDDMCSPMDYLNKHLGNQGFTQSHVKECKRSLLRCLKIIRDLTPKESLSVSSAYSLCK